MVGTETPLVVDVVCLQCRVWEWSTVSDTNDSWNTCTCPQTRSISRTSTERKNIYLRLSNTVRESQWVDQSPSLTPRIETGRPGSRVRGLVWLRNLSRRSYLLLPESLRMESLLLPLLVIIIIFIYYRLVWPTMTHVRGKMYIMSKLGVLLYLYSWSWWDEMSPPLVPCQLCSSSTSIVSLGPSDRSHRQTNW